MLRVILASALTLMLASGCARSTPDADPGEEPDAEPTSDLVGDDEPPGPAELADDLEPVVTWDTGAGVWHYYIAENPNGPGHVLVAGDGETFHWAMYDTLDWFPQIAELTIHKDGYVTWFFESGRSGPMVMAGRIDSDGAIRDVHPLAGIAPDGVGEYDFGADPAFVMTADPAIRLDGDGPLVELFEGKRGRLRSEGEAAGLVEPGWYTGPTLGADPACGASTLYKTTPGGFARVLVPDVEIAPVTQALAGPVFRDGDADSYLEARTVALLAGCPESSAGASLYLGYEFTGWGEGLVPVEHQVRPEPVVAAGVAEVVDLVAETADTIEASEEPRLPIRVAIDRTDRTRQNLVLAPYARSAPAGPADPGIWVRDRLNLEPVARSTGITPLDPAGVGSQAAITVADCRVEARTWTFVLDVTGAGADGVGAAAQHRVALGWWDPQDQRIVRAFETVVTATEPGRVEVVHSPGADEENIDDLALYWRFASSPESVCGALVLRLDRPGVPYATVHEATEPAETTAPDLGDPEVSPSAEAQALNRTQTQADRSEYDRLGEWIDPARVDDTSARILAEDFAGIRVLAATDWLDLNIYLLAYPATGDIDSDPLVRLASAEAFGRYGIFLGGAGGDASGANLVFVPDVLVEQAAMLGEPVGTNLFATDLTAGQVRAALGPG